METIEQITQELLRELDTVAAVAKLRAEGVALLYERIRKAAEASQQTQEVDSGKAAQQAGKDSQPVE